MQNKRYKNTEYIIFTALFAAIVCLFTTLFKFNLGISNGYYHIGDTFIYIGAVLLPFPFSAVAGATGSMLADLLSAYPMYMIPTFIIKFCMTLVFTSKTDKIINIRNIIAVIIASLILISGYYITEAVLLNLNFTAAIATIYGNTLQAVMNAFIFIILAYAIDKRFDLKNIFKK